MKIENCKLKIALICLFAYWVIGLFPPKAGAVSSTNDNYNIDVQDIDTAPDKNILVPTLNPQKTVKTELKQIIQPLTFSVSEALIDFGLLVSGSPSIRTTALSVVSDLSDYQVLAFEDHPLSLKLQGASPQGNETLADTTCDNGSCSETSDALWINELTYGFGFSTSGDYYKQFADISRREKPQAIISQPSPTATAGKAKEIKIIFKANISGSQMPESLSNTVTFIAVPNF